MLTLQRRGRPCPARHTTVYHLSNTTNMTRSRGRLQWDSNRNPFVHPQLFTQPGDFFLVCRYTRSVYSVPIATGDSRPSQWELLPLAERSLFPPSLHCSFLPVLYPPQQQATRSHRSNPEERCAAA